VIGGTPGIWILATLIAAGPIASRATDAAEPSVAKLVATCDRAQNRGNRGPEAAACEWYALPCACQLSRSGPASDPWCIPPGEAPAATIARVIEGLRPYPNQGAPAGPAVAATLARLYPCPGESP
jgi:hypothetical protein